MNYRVGIDLGGTQIKAAAFTPDGSLLHRETHPTRDGERVDGVPVGRHDSTPDRGVDDTVWRRG